MHGMREQNTHTHTQETGIGPTVKKLSKLPDKDIAGPSRELLKHFVSIMNKAIDADDVTIQTIQVPIPPPPPHPTNNNNPPQRLRSSRATGVGLRSSPHCGACLRVFTCTCVVLWPADEEGFACEDEEGLRSEVGQSRRRRRGDKGKRRDKGKGKGKGKGRDVCRLSPARLVDGHRHDHDHDHR